MDRAAPKPRTRRLIATACILTVLVLTVRELGFDELSGVEGLRGEVARAGSLGVLVYIAAFSIGLLAYLPGTMFVAVGVLIYGRVLGFGVALFASFLATSLTFLIVRGAGGKLLDELEQPLIRRLLDRLEDHPLTSVMLLRLFFFLMPPLNYALALSNIRYRDYIVGTLVGILPQLIVYTVLFDWVIARFSP